MMHMKKTKPKVFSLKRFFWLCLFELLYSSSGIISQKMSHVSAQAGGEARLSCSYVIPRETPLESYLIYWQKENDGKSDLVVISYKNGKESESDKDILYNNRTKMDTQNLRLSISSVTVNDSGIYKCIVIWQHHRKAEIITNLSVIVPFSKPIILSNLYREHCDPTNLTLSCLSHGGFSQPKMYGLINNKTVNWTSTVTSNKASGPFNITGTLQLNLTENMLVQCSVHFSDFHVSTNINLNMTKNCSNPTLPPPFGVIISSTVILIFFVAVVMLVIFLYYFHKHPRPSTTHQSVATDEMILQEQFGRHTPSGLGRTPDYPNGKTCMRINLAPSH